MSRNRVQTKLNLTKFFIFLIYNFSFWGFAILTMFDHFAAEKNWLPPPPYSLNDFCLNFCPNLKTTELLLNQFLVLHMASKKFSLSKTYFMIIFFKHFKKIMIFFHRIIKTYFSKILPNALFTHVSVIMFL